MADILIRGMEMPESCTHGYVGVSKTPSGEPLIRFDWCDERGVLEYTFIVLPDGHGRLIDADAMLREHYDGTDSCINRASVVMPQMVASLPTIVPAEKGK